MRLAIAIAMLALTGCAESPPMLWYVEKVRWDGGPIAQYHNRAWRDPRNCDAVALDLTKHGDVGSAYKCEQESWSPTPTPEEDKK